MNKIASLPLDQIPVSSRPVSAGNVPALATRIVIGAVASALIFLAARIVGQL